MQFQPRQELLTTFNSTSLLNVVMLLLIFFLLASSFVIQPGAKVQLPIADPRAASHPEQSVLTPAQKTDAHEGATSSSQTTAAGVGKKEAQSSLAAAHVTGKSATGSLNGASTIDRNVGKVLFGSLQWVGGGKRKKVSGDLPRYPAGVNVQSQSRIEAVVAPNGTVKSVKPAQKANARLDEEAMRELRRWRFESLPRKTPQHDQKCVVTFNFKLG